MRRVGGILCRKLNAYGNRSENCIPPRGGSLKESFGRAGWFEEWQGLGWLTVGDSKEH